MNPMKVSVTFADADDWLAFYYRRAPDGTTRFTPDDLGDLANWTPLELPGVIEAGPGTYFCYYEAGNTAGNQTLLNFEQDPRMFSLPITIGSGIKTFGGNVFRIK